MQLHILENKYNSRPRQGEGGDKRGRHSKRTIKEGRHRKKEGKQNNGRIKEEGSDKLVSYNQIIIEDTLYLKERKVRVS